MITDKETNLVYFSGLLPQKHPKFFKELKVILEHKGIEYGLLPHTKDIWCRDYMPIQIVENSFVQFKYDPCYLHGSKKDMATITDTKKVCKAIGIKPVISDIKIDGGNIVKSRTKVIMTDRILCENPQHTKEQLIKKLKRALKVKQVIIIPQCPDDPFGHADGMIRFIDGVRDEKTVLVNNYLEDLLDFKKQLHASLKKAGLNKVLIPYNPMSNDEYDASGIYINYLQVGKIVIYPTYGLKEDALAHKVFTRYFGANVIPIRSNEIAKKGGVLNCVSWNIFIENSGKVLA